MLSQAEFGMKALAQETGARAFFPSQLSELSTVYAMIAEELATPVRDWLFVEEPADGWLMRRVIVRIADKPGVHAQNPRRHGAPRDARFLGACHQLELAGDPARHRAGLGSVAVAARRDAAVARAAGPR